MIKSAQARTVPKNNNKIRLNNKLKILKNSDRLSSRYSIINSNNYNNQQNTTYLKTSKFIEDIIVNQIAPFL